MNISEQQLKEMKFFHAYAYWISPRGKIIEITQTHISKVISNPEAFDLTKEELQSMYESENERMGQEGKAREKIIKDLISKGWIRIRYYKKNGFWTININKISTKNFDLIQQWAEQIMALGFSKYDNVNIDIPNSSNLLATIEEISNDKLYQLFEIQFTKQKIILEHVKKLSNDDKAIFVLRFI